MKETIQTKKRIININRLKQAVLSEKLLTSAVFLTLALFYLSAVLISENRLLTSGVRLSDYEIGKVAEKDIIVDRDIEYIDKNATELKKEAEIELVAPVFRTTDSISQRVFYSYKQFMDLFIKLSNENKQPSEIYLEIQSALPGILDENKIVRLSEMTNTIDVLYEAGNVITEIMDYGIISYPDNFKNSTDSIEILRWINGEKVSETLKQNDTVSIENIYEESARFIENVDPESAEADSIKMLVESFSEENTFYDSEQTEKNRERTAEQVEPVVKKLVKDEVIVKKGFIITKENMIKVEALGNYSDNLNITIFFGRLFFLIFLFIISYNLFKPPILVETPGKSRLYLTLALFSIFILTAAVITRYTNPYPGIPESVFIPTALITMLISILINTRTGIISSILLSLSLFILPGEQINNFIYAFISGVFGSLVVYRAEKRITLIKAGLMLAGINTATAVMLGLLRSAELGFYFDAVLISLINGFLCGVFTLGLLPILEHILNAPTPFRLMELSDLNTPLFKRMLILAPGTYSHSVSVANLAETASKEIGANALLARVGAYYHDIGKIDQAEYFIENQKSGNKHDDMKATLSTAVIKSHVKIGYEKAKELGLPDEVMDIVAQHHGSGKISYFYMKAMKEQKIDQKLSPEDFSYNGTPPVSREAAVVMLADTVEAATRTLKNPTMAKLDRFVWDLILEKVSSGQMRNSGLTFNELEIIKKTFVQILGGSFHTRIEYPNQNGKEKADE